MSRTRANVIEKETPETAESQRLTLEFSADASARLRHLKKTLGVKSNAEVVRKSLQVLDWLVRKQQEDYRLQLAKDDSVKEVELVLY